MSKRRRRPIRPEEHPAPGSKEPLQVPDGHEPKKGYKIEGVPKALLMMPGKDDPFDLNRWLEAVENKERAGDISMNERRCLYEVRKRYPASPVVGVRARYHATLELPIATRLADAILGAIDLAFDRPSSD